MERENRKRVKEVSTFGISNFKLLVENLFKAAQYLQDKYSVSLDKIGVDIYSYGDGDDGANIDVYVYTPETDEEYKQRVENATRIKELNIEQAKRMLEVNGYTVAKGEG